jgi:cyclic pyranopterin monophosphate synthase
MVLTISLRYVVAMNEFSSVSHIENQSPTMVDVGNKAFTHRRALAEGIVKIPAFLGEMLKKNSHVSVKGPVFHTAILAGTMAAKNTAQLIPLCHPLTLMSIKIKISLVNLENILIRSEIKAFAPTGVEMEALTSVSVAGLTIYDMLKALSIDMEIGAVRLMAKSGGKNDFTRDQ